MRVVLPEGTARVSPLVLAIQANYQEDPDLEYDLPNTVQALLWACCSPRLWDARGISTLRGTEIRGRYGSITAAAQSEPV